MRRVFRLVAWTPLVIAILPLAPVILVMLLTKSLHSQIVTEGSGEVASSAVGCGKDADLRKPAVQPAQVWIDSDAVQYTGPGFHG